MTTLRGDGPCPATIRHGVPTVAVSSMTTAVNRTGSWRYIRPVYQDGVAPCAASCPVGIDIEGYMDLLRQGRVDEARDLLLLENPMPATTGRVCPHPCEAACNRRLFDEAVSIHAVERMLGDAALERLPAPAERRRAERVAIVGSGPAGLSCAYHLARLGYGVTIFEADDVPGGVLRHGIPSYRLPKNVLAAEIDRILALGVGLFLGVRVGRDLPWSGLHGFDAVFLATGAGRSRTLDLGVAPPSQVMAGLAFLQRLNAGDAPSIGQRVVVVGGGNTAMDCARSALRLGAEVTVVYRRGRQEMPAIADEVVDAEREGVRFLFLLAPVAASMSDGRLVGLSCEPMRLGPADDSGRRRVERDEGALSVVPADTVLLAIGEEADLGDLASGVVVDGGLVAVDAIGTTSRAAFFAGGDVVDQQRTVAHALGAGKRAAIAIDAWISREPLAAESYQALRYGGIGNVSATRRHGVDPVRRQGAVNSVVPYERLNVSHFVHASREGARHAIAATPAGFLEVDLGLPRHEALREAKRCFACGTCNGCELCLIYCPDVSISRRAGGGFVIDEEHCKGCGICVAECPRGAMTMVREGVRP